MAEHGILFNGAMIRPLLNTKIGTWPPEPIDPARPCKGVTRRLSERWMRVRKGDLLWVRETWAETESDGGPVVAYAAGGYLIHGAEGDRQLGTWRDFVFPGNAGEVYPPERWTPSIHMPRWASRITLEATEDARREPLSAITEEEARLEGVYGTCGRSRSLFVGLWQSLHAKPGERWQDDPAVTRLAFKIVEVR